MDDNRLIDIETRISYQEKIIRDLNDVVIEQQNQIDSMSQVLDTLLKQVYDHSQILCGTGAPADEKPPHY